MRCYKIEMVSCGDNLLQQEHRIVLEVPVVLAEPLDELREVCAEDFVVSVDLCQAQEL